MQELIPQHIIIREAEINAMRCRQAKGRESNPQPFRSNLAKNHLSKYSMHCRKKWIERLKHAISLRKTKYVRMGCIFS
jgi:hypothetical protein